ncbi:site-specific DNA-methyltransferase [Rathayibacter soli]|uniref:site-specific DNA-methyltransferase n=1 Tax=Rathayibacter soli TaxID=3144168 RepID=UPI0027E3FE06|nr:site-specific DNA-methyltransferase [Glaciibacter superstes]
MARKPSTSGPTPVESITHSEKRTNIPTADAAGTFFDENGSSLPPLLYPRDTSLDPQLVWRGKDEQDKADLVVDAPPIYIQEKIDPRVLIENLRKTAKKGESEPELTLFDDFDGLDELSQVEFYQHEANWANRMILGDSLQVMGSLAEREQLRGKVQMIYVDPPYGINFGSNWQTSARERTVKDGRLEDVAREAEQIKAFRDTWELGIHSYLSYLRDRLVVARDLLTESGSVFVQIGDENVHLVRALLDEVFGNQNFAGQFAFRTKIPLRTTLVPAIYDHVLWYGRSVEDIKFRRLFKRRRSGVGSQFTNVEESDGTRRKLTRPELQDIENVDGVGRTYRLTDLVSAGRTESCVFEFGFGGKTFYPSGSKSWKTNPAGISKLIAANRIEAPAKMPNYVFFADDYPVEELDNVWTDTQGALDRTYVVQTSHRVIERCVLMATDPGDLVLDPTCGSGTTAYVSENWGRRWITIDSSRVALALARQRLMGSQYPFFLLADSVEGRRKEQELSGKAMPSVTVANDVRHGFVYQRVPHITLGSITNNPDIREGMSREEIDTAIKRHAEFEYLYDKPFEDKKSVRVSGPFTVESLSPHRSLSFDDAKETSARESISERGDVTDAERPSFEQSILLNLQRAGIQNGRRDERIEFATLDYHAGSYVQAIGERKYDDENDLNTANRVAVAIGPQYGTVSPGFVKSAAKEAIADASVDLLCVLGFAFDPQATGVTEDDGVTIIAGDDGFANVESERKLGRIKVLLVRMNADLLMGEDLKKTGAGNLFTVFGEPDIDIRDTDDGKLEVELRGVDVYDPTTGEVRSRQTDRIALWMIDTDYNEESFFVRHCYFTGGNNPYKKLKSALKADINPDAWATLNRTVSTPFDRPTTGKIAIKVINDYGDEVMKVFEVS